MGGEHGGIRVAERVMSARQRVPFPAFDNSDRAAEISKMAQMAKVRGASGLYIDVLKASGPAVIAQTRHPE